MGGRILNSVDVYDPTTEEWSAGAALATARHGHSCVVMDGKLWVVGGVDGYE